MNYKEEYQHGSALDHKHCVTCIRRTCKVRSDNVTSCDLVDCPRGCPGRYHGCKETEHASLCPEERVHCINRNYGCPIMLPRKKLHHHLTICPASVIYCSAEWNRSPLVSVEPGEKPTILKEKVYTDCGQLDTALAMRDHRVLIDMLLAPRQTRRILRNPLTQVYPAAPLGRPSPSSVDDAAASEGSSKELSLYQEADNKWDSTQSWLEIQMERSKRQSQLYDASRQTATSLTSTLSYISDRVDSRTDGSSAPGSSSDHGSAAPMDSPASFSVDKPAGATSNEDEMSTPMIADKDERNSPSSLNENKVNSAEDSSRGVDSYQSTERGADSVPDNSREPDPFLRDKQETVIEDGQALSSLLSVSMGVDCITKYQPKLGNTYTFLCAQELRRDEFPHHFHNVHNHIQANLNGWMEQRCPLAYLGCPFSFRRLGPSVPGMTVCHSWLLESFGVTSHGPEADASHQTPRHLLPTYPETVDMHSQSSTADQTLALSGDAEMVSDPREQAAAVSFWKSSLAPSDDVGAESPAGSQDPQKSNDKVSETACDTTNAVSLSGVDQDHSSKEGSFSSLLDSIKLDNEVDEWGQSLPLIAKKLKYPDSHRYNNDWLVSHPGATDPKECSPSVQESSSCDQQSEQNRSSPGRQAALSQNRFCDKSPHSQVSSPQLPKSHSSSMPAKNTDGKQVIYTGIYANSCVRVDRSVTAPPHGSTDVAAETSQKVQLTDLPIEILRYITTFLDSFSLCNVSLVSRMMRDLCSSLLQERGVVSLIWEKRQVENKVSWQEVGKRWSFSTCFDPVESWSFTGHNPIPDHLITCPYNQDRFRHSDKFSIIPLNEAPMDIQIRDMLQERLRRRREFRGEMVWHSFYWEDDREAWSSGGHFADLLVALGGTLPP